MKWLEEIRDKEAENNANRFYHAQGDIHQVMPWSDCKESYKNGFDCAAKAIQEKLREICEIESHGKECNLIFYDGRRKCDCWKAKLEELGLV